MYETPKNVCQAVPAFRFEIVKDICGDFLTISHSAKIYLVFQVDGPCTQC